MALIRQLEMGYYKSTEEGNRLLTHLASQSGWADHVITRLAITRSLSESTPPPAIIDKGGKEKRKELRGVTLFGSKEDSAFLPWCVAMITEHAGEIPRDDSHASELIIAHWHRGLLLVSAELEQHKGEFGNLLVAMARRAAASMT